MQCHLIELKGAIIKKAFDQLDQTIDHIRKDIRISFLIDSLDILNAYIVSPGRQEIPRGIDDKKRVLAQKLAKYCRKKQKNITHLVKFVRVLSDQKVIIEKDGHILCSNYAPLNF